jgi:hypothetical protein
MELLTIQYLQDAKPTHIITACDDTDTCQSCGAGYKVGLSACEYCRTPVRLHCTAGPAEAPPVNRLALLPAGEFFMPAYVAKEPGLA